MVNTAPDHTRTRKEPPLTRTYKRTASDVPVRRTQSLHADTVADFVAQGADSMRVNIEGMKPATLRAGLRRALKGKDAGGVRLAQRGDDTHLVRTPGK